MYIGSTWKIFNLNNNDVASNATETAPTSSLFMQMEMEMLQNSNCISLARRTRTTEIWHLSIGRISIRRTYIELGFKSTAVIVKAAN